MVFDETGEREYPETSALATAPTLLLDYSIFHPQTRLRHSFSIDKHLTIRVALLCYELFKLVYFVFPEFEMLLFVKFAFLVLRTESVELSLNKKFCDSSITEQCRTLFVKLLSMVSISRFPVFLDFLNGFPRL